MKISSQFNYNISAFKNANNTNAAKEASKKENSSVSSKTNEKDALIESLKSQIENLQNQIKNVSQNDHLSLEEKMKKKNELQNQIQQLNSQITQRQLEIQKEKAEKDAEKINEAAKKQQEEVKTKEEKNEDIDKNVMGGLLNSAQSLKNAKQSHAISKQFEDRANVLKSEIKRDLSRSGSDRTVLKRKELVEVKEKINETSSDVMKHISKVNEKVKKYADEEKRARGEDVEEDKNDNGIEDEKENKKNKSIDVIM